MKSVAQNYIQSLSKVINNLDLDAVVKTAGYFIEARDNNKQILVFGNGGSGSTASHMVCDILKGCSYQKEKKFRILCLNDNIPVLLAYANDVSYDEAFLEQLKNYMQPGDIVLGISGSGNSRNIIKAIEFANKSGNTTIGFTGYHGGKLKEIATHSVNAMVDDMQISEDVHLIVLHILYKMLENA